MLRTILAAIATLAAPVVFLGANPAAQPPAASYAANSAVLVIGPRHGHVTPVREGFVHTGGGNIDVAQPAPDTVVVTMTGVAVAGPHPWRGSVAALDFDLDQCFDMRFEDPKLKRAKLSLEARVIGLLRSEGPGNASEKSACAIVSASGAEVLTISAPPHSVCGGSSLSINCREGPVSAPADAGRYTLHQTFTVDSSSPHSLCLGKASSSEFAPDPALDPLWISFWEPFHGSIKKDFGFQVTLKVIPETD